MNVAPNGTHAKEVALHFLKNTNQSVDPPSMSRTIVQAKKLLSDGYTKDEIIDVIDYVIEKGTNLYSFGYISRCIGDVLEVLRNSDKAIDRERDAKIIKKQVALAISEQRSGVKEDDSTERNREKVATRRTDFQSRFRKKFAIDLHEQQ